MGCGRMYGAMSRSRKNLFLMAPVLLFACAGMEPSEIAAVDMEIERAILWDFRNETRFDRVEVTCRKQVVILQGTIASMKDAHEAIERALKAAQEWDSDAEVVSELRVP